jgi:glutamyl-tRNA synthetase
LLLHPRAAGADAEIEAGGEATAAEVESKLAANAPYTIRMRVPEDETITFSDRVRGQVQFASEQIDDQVLLKSDGYPTYHLANVTDDHEMGITHVIRGEEWLSSTPKHMILYRFLGHDAPEFAHLPLLLNPDRSKLSKRQGHVAVEDYRDQDYLPEALVNFVALLGWNPGDERELFTLDELVGVFTLDRVNKAGAIFNIEKLQWFNQEYLRGKSTDELIEEARPLLVERGWSGFDDTYLASVIELMRPRMTFLRDLPDRAAYFFADPTEYDPDTRKKRWKPESAALLGRFLPRLESLADFGAAALEEAVKGFAEEEGRSPGTLIHPLRLAASGVGAGPGLYEMLAALGRETCARRIHRAIDTLG